MALRKRNSPGIEINEIDRSQYDKQTDYSLPNAPVCLVTGFADKGENYKTQWINSKNSFIEQYGLPTTIPEQYFFNASMEILNRGGILLTHKLPYNNDSKDKLSYVEYTINDIQNIDKKYLPIQNIDSTLTSYIEIQNTLTSTSNVMNLSEYDKLLTGASNKSNLITIVNINNNKYDKTTFDSLSAESENSKDCLGIIPVIISPVNALFYQHLLTIVNDDINKNNVFLSNFNIINDIAIRRNKNFTDEFKNNLIVPFSSQSAYDENGNGSLTIDNIENVYDNSLSKKLSKYFPNIGFIKDGEFDKSNLKKIGLVILKAYQDKQNNDTINFEVLESFVGSLDRNARNIITNSSEFIDNIVNSQSNYVNIFTNIDKEDLEKASFIAMSNQIVHSLGFFEDECEKSIDYNESITKPLNRMFSNLNNTTANSIDLIVDAGMSNIAQYLIKDDNNAVSNYNDAKLNDLPGKWYKIVTMFDEFCKYTRKDCIFLADCPRPFCLEGDQKIIRSSNINNTIEKTILPKLKFISNINSSYTAGYCNWFKTIDEYSGDYFWCPPSIKAAGIYCYTDIYFHPWDAPAGMTRGTVSNVVDTAFSPNDDEAGKIYLNSWNYAINYPINGIILEGQKTFQKNLTAFDRVNVRRLMLYLEKRTSQIAKYFLYEGNTAYTRQRLVDELTLILDDAKYGNGIIDYKIRCDESNNTPTTIDRNELHVSIAVKPVKTVEYIIVNFIVTNQSANVNEEVLKI